MATTTQISYGVPVPLGITAAGLASSTALLAGQQSAEVDNVAARAVDVLLGGTVDTTGAPTAAKTIEVWLWGSWDNGVTRSAGAGPTDAPLTLATAGVKSLMKQALVIATDAVARTYHFGPISLAQVFGGTIPARWGVFLTQNTGTPLGATALTYTHIQYVNA